MGTTNDDPASAALRHLRDAEALVAGSPDQAWHLYGFAVECAWKAGLSPRWGKVLGHDAADAEVLAWVTDLDPGAPGQGSAPLGGWRPDHRYWRTGTVESEALARLSADAAAQVPARVARAWASGEWSGAEEGP